MKQENLRLILSVVISWLLIIVFDTIMSFAVDENFRVWWLNLFAKFGIGILASLFVFLLLDSKHFGTTGEIRSQWDESEYMICGPHQVPFLGEYQVTIPEGLLATHKLHRKFYGQNPLEIIITIYEDRSFTVESPIEFNFQA